MQSNPNDVWIVIPAYNEGQVLGDVVSLVRQSFSNVVVVDDASADNCREIAEAQGAKTIRHPFNLGQGAALQTGIKFALSKGAKFIATFDADGQHDIADVENMWAHLRESGADIALGSRFLGDTVGMKSSRKFLLMAARAFTFLTVGLYLSDCHNGLRLLSAKAAEKIKIRQNRMAHASEIIENVRRENLSFIEVPVTITYTDYSREKGQTVGDIFVILKELLAGKLTT